MARANPIVKNKHWTAQAAWLAIRLYAVALPLTYILIITTGDAVPGVALLENTIPWIILPSIPAAMYCFKAQKRFWSWFLWISAIACFCYDYLDTNSGPNSLGADMLYVEKKAIDQAQRMTILSWNTGCGRATGSEIINLLIKENTDVCGLVEVPPEFSELAKRDLSSLYPFQVFEGEGLLRKGILSKTPVVESRTETLDSSRPWIFCSIKIGEKTFSIYLIHTSPSLAVLGRYSSDSRALAEIRTRVKTEPTIIMGDFNSTSRSSEWKRLWNDGFRDTFRTHISPEKYTFPIFGRYHHIPLPPFLRIDAIWVKGIWTTYSHIGPDGGSDHLPFIADLHIP